MGNPGMLARLAAFALYNQVGIAAVLQVCRQRGVPHARGAELAEEALQHALARLTERPEKVEQFADNERYFRNWVRVVACNHVRDILRRERKQCPLAGQGPLAARPAGPSRDVLALRELLRRLPPEDRTCLELYHGEDRTLDEVADRVLPPDGRSPNARRLTLFRRMQALLAQVRAGLQDDRASPAGAAGRPPV